MKIRTEEQKIIGHWILQGTDVIEDENSKRIHWLQENYLKEISSDATGWIILYQDPGDKRYWELCYEHGDLQGGGPPSLIMLSENEAREKYNIQTT